MLESTNALHEHNVVIKSPNDEDMITFIVHDDPPETQPADFTDLYPTLVATGWDTKDDKADNLVEFGEINYPAKLEVFVDGAEVVLAEAHSAAEAGLSYLLRVAIDSLELPDDIGDRG